MKTPEPNMALKTHYTQITSPPTPFSHIGLSHEIERGRYISKEELNKWEWKWEKSYHTQKEFLKAVEEKNYNKKVIFVWTKLK